MLLPRPLSSPSGRRARRSSRPSQRGSPRRQRRGTEDSLAPLGDDAAEDSELELLAGELAAELEEERAARAEAEAAVEKLRQAEKLLKAKHQRQLREARQERDAAVEKAEEAAAEAEGGAGTPERGGARSTAAANAAPTAVAGDGAAVECTRSAGCTCPQCDMSSFALDGPEPEPEPEQEPPRSRPGAKYRTAAKVKDQSWTGAALPAGLELTGQSRAPLHAYAQWLLDDCLEQRMRRLVADLFPAWRVWARACKTVKLVWAKKLGGLQQQMFVAWKQWSDHRAVVSPLRNPPLLADCVKSLLTDWL